MASPTPVNVVAETMRKVASAAAAKIGGVLPTMPVWIAPALAASNIGGPEVNSCHWMSYSVSSRPAALSSASLEVLRWSPTMRVTFERSTEPSSLTASSLPVEVPHPLRARVAARAVATRAARMRWRGIMLLLGS
ncbi:unannotated protein [freshwater metagenome]|uniref:Unannotated protein n=1 Tax=freshwater metagenome TaxID=449393 RepID=A0A6J6S2R1_9ZZZZ